MFDQKVKENFSRRKKLRQQKYFLVRKNILQDYLKEVFADDISFYRQLSFTGKGIVTGGPCYSPTKTLVAASFSRQRLLTEKSVGKRFWAFAGHFWDFCRRHFPPAKIVIFVVSFNSINVFYESQYYRSLVSIMCMYIFLTMSISCMYNNVYLVRLGFVIYL